jgi:CheY-like chemotaxis protein
MTRVIKPARRVLAVVTDLFFAARIAEVAKQIGVAVELVDVASALEACRVARPDLLVVDLEAPDDAAEAIRRLRADPATRDVEVLGFYPHVRHELRLAALEAGADRVLPRSAFTRRLAQVLAGEANTST